MDNANAEKRPLPSLLPAWPGFLLAGFFLVIEIFFYSEDKYGLPKLTEIPIAVLIAATLYWQFMIYRIHAFLREFTAGTYPFKPGMAVFGHFIPLFNLYWVCRWPWQLSRFLRSRGGPAMNGAGAAAALLASILLGRLFDGAVGMAGVFWAMAYITRRLRLLRSEPQ